MLSIGYDPQYRVARQGIDPLYWQASTNLLTLQIKNEIMGKLYIYLRVSTGGQTYEQQMQTITDHFRKIGSDVKNADGIVEEHVSGAVEWRQRKLQRLVEKCKDGDTIFVSELSRLGRDQADIFSLVDYATKKKGLNLFICKDNMMLENKTTGGKMMLFFYSMQAEAERTNTCERNLARAAWEREQIAKHGGFMSKGGKWVTKQGRPKGADMSAANEASARARTEKRTLWTEQSSAVKFARRKRAENWTIPSIVEEIGILYDVEQAKIDALPDNKKYPNPYGTPTGCKPTRGTVSKWLRESNPFTLAV